MEKNGHLYSQQYDHVPTSESNVFPYLLRLDIAPSLLSLGN